MSNRMLKRVILPALVVACVLAGVWVVRSAWQLHSLSKRIAEERTDLRDKLLHHADHEAVLQAAREMMANAHLLESEDELLYGDILLSGTSEQFRAVAPQVIQALSPRSVVVSGNHASIGCGQWARIGFMAFATNHTPQVTPEQIAAEVLIDGLWLYDAL